MVMPSVFVTPAVEDESPTWCCFDATQVPPPPQMSTSPDLTFLDSALNLLTYTHTPSHAPAFHRDSVRSAGSGDAVVMPRRSSEILASNYNEDSLEQEEPRRETGEDSEVIEVVRVKRSGQDDANPSKQNKSFKSRASKAFRSLKFSGKGSARSKPQVEDIFPEPPSPPVPQRPTTPSLSRRSSIALSQFFHPTLKRRSSFDVSTNSRSEPAFPASDSTTSSPYANVSHSSTTPSLNFLNAEHIYPEHLDDYDDWTRSSSPSPSTRTFSTRRRFSILSLQKLFTSTPSTSSSQALEGEQSGTTTPTTSTPSLSRESSGPSTISSSSGPDTPTEESHVQIGDYDEAGEAAETETQTPRLTSKDEPPLLMQDISFEMRLDSLHFESLTFDADEF